MKRLTLHPAAIVFVFHLQLLTSCLLVSSADNLCKQFGPRLNIGPDLDLNMFHTLMEIFLKEFFEKVDFEKKNSRRPKSMKNKPVGK